jgi:hypothetical protein
VTWRFRQARVKRSVLPAQNSATPKDNIVC